MQEFVKTYLGLSVEVQGKIFESLFVILIFLVLQKLIKKFAISKIQDIKVRYQWQKISLYITVFL